MRWRNASYAVITAQRLIIQKLLIAVDPFGQQKSREGLRGLTTMFARNSLKIDGKGKRKKNDPGNSSTRLCN